MSLALYWVSAARFSSQSRSAACGRQTEPAAAPSHGTFSRPRRQDVTHSPVVTPPTCHPSAKNLAKRRMDPVPVPSFSWETWG